MKTAFPRFNDKLTVNQKVYLFHFFKVSLVLYFRPVKISRFFD